MGRSALYALAGSAALLTGLLIGDLRGESPPYASARTPFVKVLAQQYGPADTLVLGDSLVEQTYLAGACGRTFNAGIGGARTQQAMQALPGLLEATQPRTVVIAIGANHFAAGDEMEDFRRLYPQLVSMAGGYDLILVGVANSPAASAFVAQTAKERGARYVQAVTGPTGPDGLHYTATGSKRLREAIAGACRQA
ncbi:SGNH/GDSL hydrolase family protein [Paraurantiacibacter namhicola]|uniref:SGNH hydrolase-type esterase domain-containing protein n=1 Tax=Paraurantiacibacter namhicola TaxID=645517 RepID=A0A1C7D6S2_9SPHN|nr:SGNH/GDSL hydrolase family protein [Paraurantiacibacter namhicola]ANU07148.1 hypothetical protein A6F65_00830 [Paraurantiacibacter namhicola]